MYTTVIGLEVHVQLLTQTKLFCGCANRFNPDHPNVQTCPVCLGMPGSLPVLNQQAFELAVKIGLALNCNIAPYTRWDRKQYFYPDLPKGYQISQYDLPVSSDGWMEIVPEPETGEKKRIRVLRAHLEEDAGKNLHDETGRGRDSQIDLNRAGTPLVEIVSQPDLRSAKDARIFLEELRLLLSYLGVSDCNMQEGSLRCDANVNLHIAGPDGEKIATPIVEIKNLNTFRGVELAIEYEAERQFEEWNKSGKKLGEAPKETRGWDADRGVTFGQRGKEEASDYRYFPDPDLVPITVGEAWLETVRNGLCEYPAVRRERFHVAFQLSDYDTAVIIDQGRAFADYFEHTATICGDGKLAANWVTQDVQRELKERGLTIDEFPLPAATLGTLIGKVRAEEITTKSARNIFVDLLLEGLDGTPPSAARIDELIASKGLALVKGGSELDSAIDAVLAANEKAVADFRGGKQAAIGKLIGQVMRSMRGADPQAVQARLEEKLRG